MNALPLAAIARTAGRLTRHRWSQIRSLSASLFPLSITARLTLSFAAVTVLAATANLIAQKSVSVIRLASRPESIAVVAPPPIELPSLPAPAIVTPTLKPIEQPKVPLVDRKQVEAITLEIDLLQRAGESRAAADTAPNEEQFQTAERALRRTAATLSHGNARVPPEASAVIRSATEFADISAGLVTATDERRAARADYGRRSEAIAGRLQSSLDSAWKIFGRVIARQSLLQLRTEFDALAHGSAGLIAGEIPGSEQLQMLENREHAFETTFNANRSGFAKAEGQAWAEGVDEDFHALVDLRRRIAALNARCDAAQGDLTRARAALSSAVLIASTTLVPARTPIATAAAARTPAPPSSSAHPAASSLPSLSATSPAAASPAASAPATAAGTAAFASSPLAVETRVLTETRGLDRRTRGLMGLVTAAVMLITAVISIITVRSVLSPVRRMIKATSKLADGETRVRVERGGIRELDALAGTFNDMAEKLAVAREANHKHQENLESKVRERTHQLQQLAQEDPLTSLPNRRHLSALLETSLERAAASGRRVGVFFIDVDNFKNFNDSLGHAFGDRVLMSVANRLEEFVDGLGFVARPGGDEFTFIFEDAESAEAVREVGDRLVQAFHPLIDVDARELRISVSVGASIFPDHEHDAPGLLRAADSALFRAKELGRNQFAVFSHELTASAATRFATEQGLRRALERDELELIYQPEINLATLEVELVEALLRWRMPDGRLAAPGEFLAVAEQSGLIAEINAWVLREAVRSAARWHTGGWTEARVAINISARQLLDHGFTTQLESTLDELGLPRRCIELELTETVLQTGPRTVAALRTLRERGFAIALDDFGTGYSSLTSLEQLPLSRIKLDRSLIESVDSNPRSAAIVRAILDLCAGLGLAVTAEGIERAEQLAWLASTRNLFVQGYLLSRGIPFDEVLPARAALSARIQDLLLSTPPAARARSAAPEVDPGSMAAAG